VKFGGDIAIVGSTIKLTYTVLDGGVKKVFTKPDDIPSKKFNDLDNKPDTKKLNTEGELVSKNSDALNNKQVFTKPDTPHHKTYTDTGAHKLGDEIFTFADKNAARDSLEGTIFFKEGNRFLKGAKPHSENIQIQKLGNGNMEISFFDPAQTQGYGKKYILELDKQGNNIAKYRQTIDPSGEILNTKLTEKSTKQP
jgi:hypothetical protein